MAFVGVVPLSASCPKPLLWSFNADGVENESVEQIAFADVIILNKTDLLAPSNASSSRMQEINHHQQQQQLVDDDGDAMMTFCGTRCVKDECSSTSSSSSAVSSSSSTPSLHEVVAAITSINSIANVIPTTFCNVSLDKILNVRAFDLQRTLELEPDFLKEDGEHLHDTSVTSVGICVPGELNLARTNRWLQTLLREKGVDIFRSKGVLALKGREEKFVFQGVHMLLNMEPLETWGEGEVRASKLVFIGRNLNREELTRAVYACVA